MKVVFIHRGSNDYLKTAVQQAILHNHVILIGDKPAIDSLVGVQVETYDIDEYTSEVNDFTNNYVHLSTNPYQVELFCFTRWIILRNFMSRHSTERVLYIDSDVLLYVNAQEEYENYFKEFESTLMHRTSGHTSYWSFDTITKFCNFILRMYNNKNTYEFVKLSSHYESRRKFSLDGGVCDMTALELYQYQNYGKIGEMMFIRDDATFDHNVNAEDQYFKMKDGMKDIKMIDNKPFVYNNFLGKNIQFKSLHFQGVHRKSEMKNYAQHF